MTKEIPFSIIMPVFNSRSYLGVAIESILNQTFSDFELILVDDGSTDGSGEICEEYARQDRRIRVIHQLNGGICRARNNALKIAKGVYVGFSDHDDYTEPNAFYESHEVVMRENPDFVKYGKVVKFVDANEKIYRVDTFGFDSAVYNEACIRHEYLKLRERGVFKNVWNGFFRRKLIIDKNIYFDPSFKYGGEDHDFCNKFSRYAKKLVTIDQLLYVHYIRTGFSTSSKRNPEIEEMLLLEGERLHETLKLIGFPLKDNLSIYANQLFESIVLPIIRYHLKNKTLSPDEIVDTIRKIKMNDFFLKSLNELCLTDLSRQSLKLGPFSYAFFHEKYNLLLNMIRLRYFLMK